MANKRKHPIFIPDPRGTKADYWYSPINNLEESKQRDQEYKQRIKNALIRK